MSKPTLRNWLNKAHLATQEKNLGAAELIATKVLKINKSDILIKAKDIQLSHKTELKLNNLLGRLLAGRPLAAVLKNTYFHHLNLKINSRVLSPRAESEELVEYAIKNIPKHSKVIDIGTGSGAIGLAVAKARPDINLLLTDLDKRTISLAKLNARKNKVTNTEFVKSNLLKNLAPEDLVDSYFIANLPYVNKSWPGLKLKNLAYEPGSALFAGSNGLQLIKNLLDQLKKRSLLTDQNWVLLEHDPKQFKDLDAYTKKLGYSTTKISDYVSLVKL